MAQAWGVSQVSRASSHVTILEGMETLIEAIEIIVVANASQDAIRKAVKSLAWAAYVRDIAQIGLSVASNTDMDEQ